MGKREVINKFIFVIGNVGSPVWLWRLKEEVLKSARRKRSPTFQIGSSRLDAEAIRNELIEFISRYEERLSRNSTEEKRAAEEEFSRVSS